MAPSLSEAPKNISQPEINNDFCDNNDDIVITGISGRFPNADNIEEFWNQLVSGTELSTCDDSRWPV
ncbi:fatty acid synthase-like protein, partial [Dinothrombium tinctorium]